MAKERGHSKGLSLYKVPGLY